MRRRRVFDFVHDMQMLLCTYIADDVGWDVIHIVHASPQKSHTQMHVCTRTHGCTHTHNYEPPTSLAWHVLPIGLLCV